MTVRHTYVGPNWTASEIVEMLDVTTTYEPDPDWKFTDPAGHVHCYEITKRPGRADKFTVPTAIWHPVVNYDEDGEDRDEGYYVCLECGAKVEPGQRMTLGRKLISGMKYIEGFFTCAVPPTMPGPFELSKYIEGATGTAIACSIETSHRGPSTVKWTSHGPATIPAGEGLMAVRGQSKK